MSVGVGLVEPSEELAGVRRKCLDIAPVALCVKGVEGQRALARAAGTGHHDQSLERQVDVDRFQVVGANATKADRRRSLSRRQWRDCDGTGVAHAFRSVLHYNGHLRIGSDLSGSMILIVKIPLRPCRRRCWGALEGRDRHTPVPYTIPGRCRYRSHGRGRFRFHSHSHSHSRCHYRGRFHSRFDCHRHSRYHYHGRARVSLEQSCCRRPVRFDRRAAP